MEKSNPQTLKVSPALTNAPRSLNASDYSDAIKAEQSILKDLSVVIEAERARLQRAAKPILKARLGGPRKQDQDYLLNWDELLDHRSEAICVEIAKLGYNVGGVLQLVLQHCNPSNPRVILWMCKFYKMQENITEAAIETTLKLGRDLENNLNKKRTKSAVDANLRTAEKVKDRIKELADAMVGKMARQEAAARIAQSKGVNKTVQHVMRILRELYPNGKQSWPRRVRTKEQSS